MKFFKENSYDIVKIYITQIGISIFALMMYLAVGMINADSTVATGISLTISIFATVFFFALLYCSAWEWGGKDKIRYDSGKIDLKITKALRMALIGNVPNFVLMTLGIISFSFCLGGTTAVFDAIGSICTLIYRLTAAMYQGIVQASFSFLKDGGKNFLFFVVEGIAFITLSIISALVTHLGYVMGVKEKRLFGFIKSNKKYE